MAYQKTSMNLQLQISGLSERDRKIIENSYIINEKSVIKIQIFAPLFPNIQRSIFQLCTGRVS